MRRRARAARRRRRRRDRVEVRCRLVGDEQRRVAQDRPRQRDSLGLARPTARGRPRRPGSPARPAAPRRAPRAPAAQRAPQRRLGRVGRGQPEILLQRRREDRRPLRQPGETCARHAAGSTATQIDAVAAHLPATGRAGAGPARRRCSSGAVGPVSATCSPGGASARTRRARAPAGPGSAPRRRRARPAARAGSGAGPGAPGTRTAAGSSSTAKIRSRRDHAVLARVELLAEQADRHVELRCEDQHRQPGLEPEVALRELDADRRRHERDAEHRDQLEHERAEECDPQRPHRLAPEGARRRAPSRRSARRRGRSRAASRARASRRAGARSAARASRQRRSVRARAASPIRIMKTGTSGTVTSRIRPGREVAREHERQHDDRHVSARTAWGR